MRQASNNGQKGFLNEDEEYLNEAGTITFGQDTATIFYQKKPYFTGDKIKILKPKFIGFTKENAQFFIASITKAFLTYAWGTSSFNIKNIGEQILWLPVENGQINFSFMEKFIAELEARHIAELEARHIAELEAYLLATGLKDYNLTKEETAAIEKLKDIKWQVYKIGDLFEKITTKKLHYKANDLPKEPISNYTLPCLTSSFQNQGLNYYVPEDNATVLNGVISIPSNSDVYRAYYQSRDFTVLSDAYAIRWKDESRALSPKQYLFIVQCINKVTDLKIYSYKNKLGGWKVVKNKYILLPVKDDNIDFAFMDLFISAIQKLAIKDVVLYADKKLEVTKSIVSN